MPTKYGLPTVEVVGPDGEVRDYLIREVPAPPDQWRAWVVTSPDGKSYTVTESPVARWQCSCPWWVHKGRWQCVPGRKPPDKHIVAVLSELERAK